MQTTPSNFKAARPLNDKIALPKPGNTPVTAKTHGAAPHKPGAAVQGFSGSGAKPGKI